MKLTSKTLIAITVSTIASVTGANAQSTAIASTTATLITPISISKVTDLNFGTIASSDAEGAAVVGLANVATLSGGLTSPDASAGATTASFTVTGETTSTFDVTIPTQFTISNGTNTLAVTAITADVEEGTSALVGGTKTINIGATLTVPANTAAGTYVNDGAANSGLYVTVNYN
jgi:hypothetical protein